MSRLYPIALDLEGRPVLVVGGGEVAARKLRSFQGTGARVTLVATEISGEAERATNEAGARVYCRPYRSNDVRNKWLVIAATNNSAVNAKVYRDSEDAGVYCNVVDQPDYCSFQSPAVARRGRLQIAVSTHGASPALAARIRKELEDRYGKEYEILLEGLCELRRWYKGKYPDDGDRRAKLLESFLSSRTPVLLLRNSDGKAFRRSIAKWKSR
jgi:siroheme synthase-like protein